MWGDVPVKYICPFWKKLRDLLYILIASSRQTLVED
jgi:hypothetical protein